MTWQGWLQIAVFAALITAVVKPLGGYIARSVDGSGRVQRALAPIENGLYRLAGVDPAEEQSWVGYALALLWFHLAGIVALYALQRVQNLLPLNPQQFDAVAPDLALNTAVSFATNTSWQSYGGETTLSYLSQMAGITVQSFLSGATGVAVAIALVRGFARRSAQTIGNFWVDLTRITLYVLLPICVVAGLFLVWQGVPQTLGAYVERDDAGRRQSGSGARAGRLAGGDQAAERRRRRLLQRQLGASVREPDSPGRASRDAADLPDRRGADQHVRPHGRRSASWLGTVCRHGGDVRGRPRGDLRQRGTHNAALSPFGIDQAAGTWQAGGNMEGKEVRFGVGQSALFATVTTASSDGAVNSMHDSFMPLSGLVLMANMMLDEVIVGGPGSGLFGILLFAIVAVFAAGLMIGRTPEYLGKKIEGNEVKMTMLALLCVPAFILGMSAVAAVLPAGLAGLNNAGPHGFSELLYAYTSGAATNGSAFAGLSANTPFYNLTLAAAMFAGRFIVIVPVLCIAGMLAAKRVVPASAGTLPTHGMQFVGLLVGTVVIVGGLTFFPALALGPVAEHFAMQAGSTY